MAEAIFEDTRQQLEEAGFRIVYQELNRPWGGFYYVDPVQAVEFVQAYFPELELDDEAKRLPMQPKFLMVAPGKRLSWQYHHRRAEVWRVITGPVGVMSSLDDEPGEVKTLVEGDMVTMQVEQRHRLIGEDGWGVVAEIWQHTDAVAPSDEDDIVRVSDDFGR